MRLIRQFLGVNLHVKGEENYKYQLSLLVQNKM